MNDYQDTMWLGVGEGSPKLLVSSYFLGDLSTLSIIMTDVTVVAMEQ